MAARNWTLYPPEHPAVETAVERLREAVRQSSFGSAFGISITPHTLLIDGVAPASQEIAIAEAASLLHDRDLVHITFLGDLSYDGVCALLRLLALDASERRQRGGPERIWAAEGHPSIIVQQIDYTELFARQRGEVVEAAKKDDVWRSIVMATAGGQQAVFDERAQQRLLEIAGSPSDIAELAVAASASKRAADGSPMIMSQAATIVEVFRQILSTVSVMSPERGAEAIRNIASAIGELDPRVVMQVLQTAEESDSSRTNVIAGIAAAFDDENAARLVSAVLMAEGGASERLASVFNTIVPDPERKRRVLTLARRLLSEAELAKSGQMTTIWASAEALLVSYDDSPFVSEAYRTSLDGLGGRAERLATGRDLPPELPEWLKSLGQDSVRELSVQLLLDLLALEQDADRAAQIAGDMAALAEDLLLSGAYKDVQTIVRTLAARAGSADIGNDACRQALAGLGQSTAMAEAALLLGDFDTRTLDVVNDIIIRTGVTSVEALKPVLSSEQETAAAQRAAELVLRFGREAVPHLESMLDDARWFVQRNAARLLGHIASPDAVPLLQPLLRKGDRRVARAAVSALASIHDPAAARAIHTVLRAATGELRAAVIDALVADRDARVVPMLARIIAESQPLGADHQVVLEAVTALGAVGSDTAVPTLSDAARIRSFWRRGRKRAIKQRAITSLTRIGTDRAKAALDQASRHGDRMVRRLIRARERA